MTLIRTTGWPFLAWVVFVIYGSLLPFDFQPQPLENALAGFRHMPFLKLGVESRADWVANGVLYLPIGFLGFRWLAASLAARMQWLAVILAIVVGTLLAAAVEFAQLYFPSRTVSQNDLIAECMGSMVGALVAPMLQPWAARLMEGWSGGGTKRLLRGLEVYAACYVGLSLFPYDLLLSTQEWQAKLGSPLWGPLLAPAALEREWLVLPLLGVEMALALPLGLLLALGRQPVRTSIVLAGLSGAALGVLIEGGQLAIASGITQGASILTRVAGVALGAWLVTLPGYGLPRLRAFLQHRAGVLGAVYLLLLLAANGWFNHPWRSLGSWQAQWDQLRLMPFYYHYFTTEAIALFSLGSVALMYLPVALIGWARWRPLRADLLIAGGLALMVETGKLWLDGLHPDPSNPLIAMASCFVLRRLISTAESQRNAAAMTTPVTEPMPIDPRRSTAWRLWAVTLPILGLAAASTWRLPAAAEASAVVLVAAAALAWRWPVSVLFVVPAAMPVLDWAPWTGHFYWDEFDLLLSVTLIMGWYRTSSARDTLPPAWIVAWCLLGTSLIISTGLGLLPWQALDGNSFNSYASPFNALRIVKGAFWATAFVLVFRRVAGTHADKHRCVALGLVAGLALTIALVLWERAAFVGLFNFEDDYRITGPFSAMHTGGATIECFLAVGAALGMAVLFQLRLNAARAAMLVLLVLASYAVMVTYSRNGFAALLAAGLVMVLAVARRPAATTRGRLAGLAVVLAMTAAATPILLGGFAQQRLAQTVQDFHIRLDHWRDALALRDDNATTLLLGAGIGRFPAYHYWRSAEPARAGLFSLDATSAEPVLRLGAGTPVYVEQVVDVGEGQRLRLTLSQRATPGAQLGIALCEKWMLTSAQCARIEPGPVQASNGWQRAEWLLDTTAWTSAPWPLKRPVKFSLFHGGEGGAIEVANVQLAAEAGGPLLINGDFRQGLDRWFFSTDVDPPWHIHSWPVTVLFEQGWLGVLAWSVVLAMALAGAGRRAWLGDMSAAGVLAALVAFGVSGLVNTLTDTPRLLWLLCLLLWLAAGPPGLRGRASRNSPMQA